MRRFSPADLLLELVETYDLFWRLDSLAVELQTMVLDALRDHSQHLLEMKMGSPTWRELANGVLYSTLCLTSKYRDLSEKSWDNLLEAAPGFAHNVATSRSSRRPYLASIPSCPASYLRMHPASRTSRLFIWISASCGR